MTGKRAASHLSRQHVSLKNLRSLSPPNWSLNDWNIELDQVGAIAACEATTDFDPTRGVPLVAFINQRVRQRGLTAYRREWRFGLRHLPASPEKLEVLAQAEPEDRFVFHEHQEATDANLVQALQLLYPTCRDIILALFWRSRSEAEIASALSISQQAISKRKTAILKCLRASICPDCRATVACSGRCWKKHHKTIPRGCETKSRGI